MLSTITDRYIFARALRATLSVLLALVGVVWIVQAVQRLDVLLTKGQGIWTYLQMTLLGVPLLAAAVAPIALLIGIMQTIGQLNQDSEHVVLHASGGSSRVLLRPLMTLAVLMAVLVYLLQLWLAPAAMRGLRDMVTQVRADLVAVIVQEGGFHPVSSGLTLHVGKRLPNGSLESLLIQDRRDPKETITYTARAGSIIQDDTRSGPEGTYLLLSDGSIQRTQEGEDRVSVISFRSYTFSLAAFGGGGSVKDYKRMETPTWQLIRPDPANKRYQRSPDRFVWELHVRLTGGLWPIVVALAAVAFLRSPVSNRDRQSGTAIGLVAVVVGTRASTIVAEASLRDWAEGTPILWLVPFLTMAALASLLVLDREPSVPRPVRRALAPLTSRWNRMLDALRRRFVPAAPEAAG